MPKIIDHDRYRAELVERCRELFAHRGYRTLSMREIAAALGVSTGTLYHYFPDKRSLFTQCVEATTQDDALRMETNLASNASQSDKLAALFRFVAEHEHGFLHQIVVTLDYYQEQELRPAVDEPVRVGIQRDRQAITKLLESADEATVTMVMSQIIGLLVLRLFEGETRPFTEQAAELQRLLAPRLDGLRIENIVQHHENISQGEGSNS
jgi:AcrR family transcriptional regulator